MFKGNSNRCLSDLDCQPHLPYHLRLMHLDLHTHSVSSDDSRATVEQYINWIALMRKQGYQIDGFVLTEHRQFNHDLNYQHLSYENDILILKGAELDTDSGHFLVYGITEQLSEEIDFSDVNINAAVLVETCVEKGAVAIPAHPGRNGIGFANFIDSGYSQFKTIKVVEQLNGSNRASENARTSSLIKKFNYLGIGGSDSHVVSTIGTCMTHFENKIDNEEDLVRELKGTSFKAIHLREAISTESSAL